MIQKSSTKITRMKKIHFILAIVITISLGACKKEGTGGASGMAITDEATAKAAFLKINNLWTATLEPMIAKTEKTYKDETISGPNGGQAVINGRYYKTRFSSSSSSTSTTNFDMLITFKNYVTDGMTLDGTVRFFEFSESRSACSSSGCAFTNHYSISYDTNDGSDNNFPPLGIQFDNNGSKVNDKILIESGKSDNFRWGITVTNSAGQAFTFNY